jgi:hypothetical protein
MGEGEGKAMDSVDKVLRTPEDLHAVLTDGLILEVRHLDDGFFVRIGDPYLDNQSKNPKAGFSRCLYTGDPRDPSLSTFGDPAGLSLPASAVWFMEKPGRPATIERIADIWGDNLWSGGKALASPWTAMGRVLPESEFVPALDLLMGPCGDLMETRWICSRGQGKSIPRSQLLSYFLTSCWIHLSRYYNTFASSGIVAQADFWPDPTDLSTRIHPLYERVLALLNTFAQHPGAPAALRQSDRGPMENTTWSIIRQVAAAGDEGVATDVGASIRWLMTNGYPEKVSPIVLPPDPRVLDLMRKLVGMEKFIPGLTTNSLQNSPPVFKGHLRRYGFTDIEELRDWLQRARIKNALYDGWNPNTDPDETPIL